MKRISNDVMNVLLQLRFLLKKLFDLQDYVNGMFSKFEDENFHKDSFQIPNPTVLLDYHKERYPDMLQGINKMSMKDIEDKKAPSIIIEDQELGFEKRFSANNPNPYSPTILGNTALKTGAKSASVQRSLVQIDHPEAEYPSKMATFIRDVNTVFKNFYNEHLIPRLETHNIFAELYDQLHHVSQNELSILEDIQREVFNVQVNQMFYNKQIKPLTKIYKFFSLLNKYQEKASLLKETLDKMEPCLQAIKGLTCLRNLRGGIEMHILKYNQVQEMISNSLFLISELFNMGFTLNENELKNTLSSHIRVEKGNIDGFLSLLEKRFERVLKGYRHHQEFVEEETN